MTILPFLYKVNEYVLNPVIKLVFGIAFLVFFYGIFQFISKETGDKEREQGKKKIMYGILGMFIMFSAFSLIRIILDTFNINPPSGTLPF